jgi:hypothetical protein
VLTPAIPSTAFHNVKASQAGGERVKVASTYIPSTLAPAHVAEAMVSYVSTDNDSPWDPPSAYGPAEDYGAIKVIPVNAPSKRYENSVSSLSVLSILC